MFYQKKKKEYSEVSESKININSDYFNVLKNEFNNFFSKKKNDDINILKSNDININSNENQTTQKNEINNKTKIENKMENKMSNLNYKNIEINDNDVFFINMISKHIKTKLE